MTTIEATTKIERNKMKEKERKTIVKKRKVKGIEIARIMTDVKIGKTQEVTRIRKGRKEKTSTIISHVENQLNQSATQFV